jgi:hypothetical protein
VKTFSNGGNTQGKPSSLNAEVQNEGQENGTERLLRLAEFLEKLPPKKFYFGTWVKEWKNECGTVCCAIGWCPVVFPEHFKWCYDTTNVLFRRGNDWMIAAWHSEDFFDLTDDEFSHLFHPNAQEQVFGGRKLDERSRPKTVAANIREFVNRKWPALAGTTASSPEPTPAEPLEGNQ